MARGKKRRSPAPMADDVDEKPLASPRFFKVFLPKLSAQRLRIPPAFEKCLKSIPSASVCLRGPSGFSWPVELVQSSDGLYFGSGWKEFVADHFIKAGDFIVFQYDDKSCFSVVIFDATSCEKKATLCAIPGQGRKIKVEEMSEDDEELAFPSKAANSYFRKPDLRKNHKTKIMLSRRRSVTDEELSDTLAKAKEFKSANPFVLIVMAESYVYTSFFLYIPCKFVREHLPRVSKTMTLWDPQGRSWDVAYLSYIDRRGGAFSGGWASFSVANNLEKGDVCIFELINSSGFKVHIYRVVESIVPLLCAPHPPKPPEQPGTTMDNQP